MIKKKLKHLNALIKEAEHLQEEIDNYKFKPGEYLADTVKDYRTGHPRTIKIEGYGQSDYAENKEKLIAKLNRKKQEAYLLRIEVEEWLDTIDDPEMRDMIRLKYIHKRTLEEIGSELGYADRTIKEKFKKFWDKYKSMP